MFYLCYQTWHSISLRNLFWQVLDTIDLLDATLLVNILSAKTILSNPPHSLDIILSAPHMIPSWLFPQSPLPIPPLSPVSWDTSLQEDKKKVRCWFIESVKIPHSCRPNPYTGFSTTHSASIESYVRREGGRVSLVPHLTPPCHAKDGCICDWLLWQFKGWPGAITWGRKSLSL